MTETTNPEAERELDGGAARRARRMWLHFALVLLVAVWGGAVLGGVSSAWSAGLGVSLSAGNVLVMRQIMRALVGGGAAAAAWGLAFPLKLVVLVGLAFVLVERGAAKPVPLAIGFALLPLSGVFLPRTAGTAAAAPERRGRASDVPANEMKHRA